MGAIALIVALGGNASALPGTDRIDVNDLRNNVVGHLHIKANAVRSSEIQADAVGASEIAPGAVQDGELGTIVERDGPNVEINDPANDGDWSTGTAGTSQSVAQCDVGEKLIGGTMEWDTDGGVNGDLAIVKMFPHFDSGIRTWTAVGSSDEGTVERFHAVAFCLQ